MILQVSKQSNIKYLDVQCCMMLNSGFSSPVQSSIINEFLSNDIISVYIFGW